MIKLGQLKSGDIVIVNEDGSSKEGTVVQTNGVENKIHIENGTQEFRYQPQDLFPVTLDEGQLI
jgi:hypothetical protein